MNNSLRCHAGVSSHYQPRIHDGTRSISVPAPALIGPSPGDDADSSAFQFFLLVYAQTDKSVYISSFTPLGLLGLHR